MLKGASRAVLKIVEQELHEAWRKGYEEGRNELVRSAVPEILAARFGPEVRQTARSVVPFIADDRFVEMTVLAATCPDFGSFYQQALFPKRKRKR